MRFEILRRVRGLPHRFDGDRLIASRGNVLMQTTDLGLTWTVLGRISDGIWDAHLRWRPAERLLRRSISHALCTPAGSFLVIASRRLYRRAAGEVSFTPVLRLERGSRPMHRGLCLTSTGRLYLGEYFGNPRREPVRVWRSQDDGRTWSVVYTFPAGTIRHVHAIQEDPFHPGEVWVLCGDLGTEARILRTSADFSRLDCIGSGDQTWRATAVVFTPDAVYYGMDSPLDCSRVYRWDRTSGERTALVDVHAPIYYGYRNASGALAFGTTIEPGPAVRDDVGRIWASPDGYTWQPVLEIRKDAWPDLFQYGCFFLPDGIGPGDTLVFGAVALSGCDGDIVFGRLTD